MSSELTKKAMLVSLHIKHWSDTSTDKEVGRTVAENAGVDVKVGKYVKNLLPKTALKPLKEIKAAAREMHYELTMPWDDSGVRLLPVQLFDQYEQQMRAYYNSFDTELRALVDHFTDYQDQARIELGPMYKDADYPHPDRLDEKCEFSWNWTPVPDSSHFIADLATADADRIRADIEEQLESRIKGTVHDLYQRLGNAVTTLSERLSIDDDGKAKTFHKSALENLREICNIIPQLNITGDMELARLCEEVKQAISDVDVNELRVGKKSFDSAKHQYTRDSMKDISNRFAGYFGTTIEGQPAQEMEPAQGLEEEMVSESEPELTPSIGDIVPPTYVGWAGELDPDHVLSSS